jgi:hypothetical protein
LAACAVALTIPLSAVAGSPAKKVTGNMWFTNGTYGYANFTFSGQDLGAANLDKGTASYTDSQGTWSGTATNVEVKSLTDATMTVVVTSSTHPDVPAGGTHIFHFVDNGEAGINTGLPTSDYFTYGTDSTLHTAEAGNIQIHLYG